MIIALALFALPFRRSSVHCNHEILARFIASSLDCFQNGFNGFIIAGQVRCKAAFVTNGSCQTLCLQNLCQAVEYFCTPTQCFLKGWSTNWHNHEFLCINGIGCMCTTVQNIHHWNWKSVARYAAQEPIQRNIQRDCSSSCSCNGNCQNGICTQIGLVLCAICCEHCTVNCIDIRSIQPNQCIIDGGVDVFYCLGNTLTTVTSLVAVPQFQCFKFTSGCTARCSTSADCSICQQNFCFYGRIASGVHNFSADDLFNFQISHFIRSFPDGNLCDWENRIVISIRMPFYSDLPTDFYTCCVHDSGCR